jgi:hypothetical protein
MATTASLEGTFFWLAEPLFQLSKDMLEAARGLKRENARWLVDRYYEVQEDRKRASNQLSASSKEGEPCRLIEWSFKSQQVYERSLKLALGEFAQSYKVGAYLQSITGIGPILSAGMLVNFDIRKAPSVGHFWRFAGLDPTLKWLGKEKSRKFINELLGRDYTQETLPTEFAEKIHDVTGQHSARAKDVYLNGYVVQVRGKMSKAKKGKEGLILWLSRRPWNMNLKTLCVYRFGETQVKFCNHKNSFYGPLYSDKKVQLVRQNENGEFKDYAEQAKERVGKTTDAYKAYSAGMLPPGQIHNRARRWMVKLFLSHLHHVMYLDFYYVEPPRPYIFEHPGSEGSRHAHVILPPSRICPGGPVGGGGKSLGDLF